MAQPWTPLYADAAPFDIGCQREQTRDQRQCQDCCSPQAHARNPPLPAPDHPCGEADSLLPEGDRPKSKVPHASVRPIYEAGGQIVVLSLGAIQALLLGYGKDNAPEGSVVDHHFSSCTLRNERPIGMTEPSRIRSRSWCCSTTLSRLTM